MFVNTVSYLLILFKLITIESSIHGEDCPTKPMIHVICIIHVVLCFHLAY